MASTNRYSLINPSQQIYRSPELQANALASLLKDAYEANNFKDWREKFEPFPLLSALKQGSTNKEVINWDYAVGKPSVDYISDYATPVAYSRYVGDTDSNTSPTWERRRAQLEMSRGAYYATIDIESLENQGSKLFGDAEAKDLLKQKIDFVLNAFGRTLNELVYGNSVAGLEYFFNPSLMSYATIPMRLGSYTAKVDGYDYFSVWRPLVGTADYSAKTLTFNDEGVSAATVRSMEAGDIFNSIEHFDIVLRNKKRKYNAIYANPDTVREYAVNYRSQVVINMPSGGLSQAEIAYQAPTFKGRRFIEDPNIPVGTIYFLDLSDVELVNIFPYDGVKQQSFYNPTSLAIVLGELGGIGTIFVRKFQVAMLEPRLLVRDMAGLNKLILTA